TSGRETDWRRRDERSAACAPVMIRGRESGLSRLSLNMKKSTIALCIAFSIAALMTACKRETQSAPSPAPAKPAATTSALPPNSWQVPVDVLPAPPPNPPQTNYLDL